MVQHQEQTAETPKSIEQYYTVAEVEKLLKTTRSTLDRMAKRGQIRKTKVGGSTLFAESEIKNILFTRALNNQ